LKDNPHLQVVLSKKFRFGGASRLNDIFQAKHSTGAALCNAFVTMGNSCQRRPDRAGRMASLFPEVYWMPQPRQSKYFTERSIE
jgi:hypothetical protein